MYGSSSGQCASNSIIGCVLPVFTALSNVSAVFLDQTLVLSLINLFKNKNKNNNNSNNNYQLFTCAVEILQICDKYIKSSLLGYGALQC